MASLVRSVAAITLGLALAGCAEAELYTGLTEREANDMIAVLKSAGLDADKSTKDGKSWTMLAPRSEFPQAVALLETRGLPKERYQNLGEIFKKDGFVSSPLEEHARLIYGLSQELSNTISTMDGVVVARVHIALPTSDPLAESQKPSSASVFIKYDPQVDISAQIGPIKSLVVNSVEGLPYERVSVVVAPARPFLVSPAPAKRAPSAGLLWIAAAFASAVLAVFALWRLYGRSRERLA